LAFGGITLLLVVAFAVQTREAEAITFERLMHERSQQRMATVDVSPARSAFRVKHVGVLPAAKRWSDDRFVAPDAFVGAGAFGLSNARPNLTKMCLPPPAFA
jgi:hypothetical protein